MPSVSKLAPSQWLVTWMEDRRGVDEEEGGVCIKEILARVLTLIHFDKTLQVARPQENLLVFRRNFGEKNPYCSESSQTFSQGMASILKMNYFANSGNA